MPVKCVKHGSPQSVKVHALSQLVRLGHAEPGVGSGQHHALLADLVLYNNVAYTREINLRYVISGMPSDQAVITARQMRSEG
jgi:hypothetical protein